MPEALTESELTRSIVRTMPDKCLGCEKPVRIAEDFAKKVIEGTVDLMDARTQAASQLAHHCIDGLGGAGRCHYDRPVGGRL